MAELEFVVASNVVRGNIVQSYKLPRQNRQVILIEGSDDSRDKWSYSFIYNGNSIIDLAKLKEKFGDSYDKIEANRHLPEGRNIFNLTTLQRYFLRDKNFDRIFWYLMEKVFEIRMHDKIRRESSKKDFYVNSCIDEVVRYHSRLKHPLEIMLATGASVKGVVSLYFPAIAEKEMYTPLIFSDMDVAEGNPLKKEMSQDFFRVWQRLGYDRKRIFAATPEELADATKLF